MRNRRAYADRPEEVPERLLRPWRRRVAGEGAASLDDMAELAGALTDAQARGLHQYWGWYFEATPAVPPSLGVGRFYGGRHHLRLWASLTPRQREAALQGAFLPAARMTPRQRQAFVTALVSPVGLEMSPDGLDHDPTPQEIAAGGFSLKAGEPHLAVNYQFNYYLSGDPTPAREDDLQLFLQPAPAALPATDP